MLAMFAQEAELADALHRLRQAGIGPIETFTPAPLHGAPGYSPIPLIILLAGVAGAAASFALQAYSSALAYPFKVGGRPEIAWPSFVPTVFENAVLVAIAAGFVAFAVANGFPRLYHRIDESPLMRRVSRDRWVLQVCSRDPAVLAAARAMLEPAALQIEEFAA